MQLTYRGISYLRTHSAIPTTKMETRAKFRGQSYEMQAPITYPEPTRRTLIYRGISYTKSYGMKAPISYPEPTQRTLIYRGISYTIG